MDFLPSKTKEEEDASESEKSPPRTDAGEQATFCLEKRKELAFLKATIFSPQIILS